VDLDGDRLAKVAEELSCESVVADIGTEEGVAAVVSRTDMDILCNNAGILDSLTPLLAVDDALWDQVMRVNLTAPFKLCRGALPAMIERGGGVIVNTCSAASLSGGRAGCAYTASKHGLLGLTRSIAWYYGDKGIRCNAIAPGAIQTKMHFRNPPHTDGLQKYSRYFGTMPEHGKAIAVAEAALYLASDASGYVNGEVLTVDGGWNAF
ncbi:MAG: SDR family oxidoreductase, partial [Myxococcota bacterium]|nr:SDR family oxidoreductase [Myxococcota bacterium]